MISQKHIRQLRRLKMSRQVQRMKELQRREMQKIKEESGRIKSEVRQRTISYVVASLGLVAGLAWNDAIKSAIEYFFPINSKSITAKFVYTIIMTLMVIILTTYLVKLLGNETDVQK